MDMFFLVPIIFVSVFFVVFIIIAVFVFKNAKSNIKTAQKTFQNMQNLNEKETKKDKSKICDYCGNAIDNTGKCESCGATKKIEK